ncbi:hypothetical protein KCU78_g1268, partial [Aureobasidium melanogenum]
MTSTDTLLAAIYTFLGIALAVFIAATFESTDQYIEQLFILLRKANTDDQTLYKVFFDVIKPPAVAYQASQSYGLVFRHAYHVYSEVMETATSIFEREYGAIGGHLATYFFYLMAMVTAWKLVRVAPSVIAAVLRAVM